MMQDTMPARALQALLRPRAIALVGVSPKGGAGARILQSNARFDRAVPIWPVNPHHREIAGQRCYGSLMDLPQRPDCVVIAVPATAVLDDLETLRARASERDQFLNLLQRTRADFENYQKRNQKERAQDLRYANTKFAEDLLPVIDNLERATAAARSCGRQAIR